MSRILTYSSTPWTNDYSSQCFLRAANLSYLYSATDNNTSHTQSTPQKVLVHQFVQAFPNIDVLQESVQKISEIEGLALPSKFYNVGDTWWFVYNHEPRTLADLIQDCQDQGTELDEETVRCILHHIMITVRNLHQRGVIVEAIQPESVLIGSDNTPSLMLTLCYNQQFNQIHEEKNLLGYVAPEILLDISQNDSKSIVWSIACIYWHMKNLGSFIKTDTKNQRINKIFYYFGKPDPEDWPEVSEVDDYALFNDNHEDLYDIINGLNSSSYSFISKMLTVIPSQRISLEEACDHDYITTPIQSTQLQNDSLQNNQSDYLQPNKPTISENESFQNDSVLSGLSERPSVQNLDPEACEEFKDVPVESINELEEATTASTHAIIKKLYDLNTIKKQIQETKELAKYYKKIRKEKKCENIENASQELKENLYIQTRCEIESMLTDIENEGLKKYRTVLKDIKHHFYNINQNPETLNQLKEVTEIIKCNEFESFILTPLLQTQKKDNQVDSDEEADDLYSTAILNIMHANDSPAYVRTISNLRATMIGQNSTLRKTNIEESKEHGQEETKDSESLKALRQTCVELSKVIYMPSLYGVEKDDENTKEAMEAKEQAEESLKQVLANEGINNEDIREFIQYIKEMSEARNSENQSSHAQSYFKKQIDEYGRAVVEGKDTSVRSTMIQEMEETKKILKQVREDEDLYKYHSVFTKEITSSYRVAELALSGKFEIVERSDSVIVKTGIELLNLIPMCGHVLHIAAKAGEKYIAKCVADAIKEAMKATKDIFTHKEIEEATELICARMLIDNK